MKTQNRPKIQHLPLRFLFLYAPSGLVIQYWLMIGMDVLYRSVQRGCIHLRL